MNKTEARPAQGVVILLNDENRHDHDFIREMCANFKALELTVSFEEESEYTARGRVPDCDCQLLSCVCAEARTHAKDCRFRKALTCAIPIACEAHGYDVCPVCDPCTCGPSKVADHVNVQP